MPKNKPSEVEIVAMAMFAGHAGYVTAHDAVAHWKEEMHAKDKDEWRALARAFRRAIRGSK